MNMCFAVSLQWFVTAARAAPFLAKCEARAGEACHGNVQQLSAKGKLAVVMLLRWHKRV